MLSDGAMATLFCINGSGKQGKIPPVVMDGYARAYGLKPVCRYHGFYKPPYSENKSQSISKIRSKAIRSPLLRIIVPV